MYSYISVIALSLVIALSILSRGAKHSLNRNAFYFTIIIGLWTIGGLAQWLMGDAHTIYVFSRLSSLIDFFYLFFLFFSYAMAGEKLSWKKKFIFALPLSVTLFSVASGYGMGGVGPGNCSYGIGWAFFYSTFINIAYSAWAFSILIRKYLRPLTYYKTKLRIRVLLFSIVFFMLWNVAYQATAIIRISDRWDIKISPYFITGNLFFMVLMIFNIIEYDLFEFDVTPRKWLAFAIISIIFWGMFFFVLTPMVYFILLLFYVAIIWMFWGK